MESTQLSGKGQIQIPATLRHKLKLEVGRKIAWTEKNGVLIGIPETSDPIETLFGSLKGTGILEPERFYAQRKLERQK